MARRTLCIALVLAAASCTTEQPPLPVPVAATAIARGATSVEITFTAPIANIDASALQIFTPFDRPEVPLEVRAVDVSASSLLIETAPQTGGRLYAVVLPPMTFEAIDVADAPTQVNFEGFGTAQVVLSLDTRGFLPESQLAALVTFDADTGAYSERFSRIDLADDDGDEVFTATISVKIDKRRSFAARAVRADGQEAGALSRFTVDSTDNVLVTLSPRLDPVPEFEPPIDPIVGDGFAPVRIILDDRYARALGQPALRFSLDGSGAFDIASTRVEVARPVAMKTRVYEVIVSVAVAPDRKLDGTMVDDFPYITFLVEGGEDVPERGTSFVMQTEQPQVIVMPIANPELVPVTFRVDAGSAYLDPQGTLRGLYPGEGLFLTGEFPGSEDALGRLAADAFSGGERSTLEMDERPDAPGIFEKTVFMGKNRPYGWKVVRCATGVGCAELNRHVASSGRAFPTVMKNLTSSADDAASSPAVDVIDPANPGPYAGAPVSTDGTGDANTIYKQEAPDLVVMVGTEPVVTPIYIVGTWRDVNIPQTPSEIIRDAGSLDLSQFDYDDGLVGRAPLLREINLPLDPGRPVRPAGQPAFDGTDGRADATARQLSAGPGRLPLWIAWNERDLYVATQPAPAGSDHFIIVSLDAPATAKPAQWAKGGTSQAGNQAIFLAMEGDGMFSGWFTRGPTGNDDMPLEGLGVTNGRGDVLEGAVELSRAGTVGDRVWVAVVAYGTADGGALAATAQHPAGNGDLNLDAAEFIEIPLASVRAP